MEIDFTTVSRAYVEARHRGLVEARVGQGTFVRVPSAARGVADQVHGRGDGPDRRHDDGNQPPAAHSPDGESPHAREWRPPPCASICRISCTIQGPETRGRTGWRAAWLAPRLPDIPAERLLVTPGTQGALLALLAALTRPGDTVFYAEALTYPGFKAIAGQLGLRIVGVSMDADGIDPDALRHAFSQHRPKALYCIPTFHNPTTATMPLERRHAVVAAARDHGVPIIEDDVYGPLPDNPQPPLAALAPDKVYHIAGLAKCVSPMLRVSYVVSPDARQALRVAAAQRGTTLMALPLTAAIARRWIADVRRGLLDAIRLEAMARRTLAESILPADNIVTKPEAFHLWLRLPETWSRGEFTAHLRTRGIAAVASDAFATTPETPDALRICLGAAAGREETRQVLEEIIADALDQLPSSAGVII